METKRPWSSLFVLLFAAGCGGGDKPACTADCDGADAGVDARTDAGGDAGEPAPRCGDGVVGDGEQCDLGARNDDQGACRTDCMAQRCGDGFVGPGEGCDDGNDVDGDACSDCVPASCGDGVVDPGEACDDGNADAGDACLPSCAVAACGDGVVQRDVEVCDDGNPDDADACLTSCVPASCGDGVVHDGVEECDDGDADETDDCLSGCTTARCGDAAVRAGVEVCDDGQNDGSYGGCTADCLALAPHCGDGNVDAGEECDDANDDPTDGCSACLAAICGDGVVRVGAEECDDANDDATDACVPGCLLATCGDGFVRAGVEDCDDGDPNGGPCSAFCRDPGSLLWQHTFDGSNHVDDFANALSVDAAGDVLVAGREGRVIGGRDFYSQLWFGKFRARDGGALWTATYQSDGARDEGAGVAVDADGNVIAAGSINENGDSLWLRLLDPDGDELWTITASGVVPLDVAAVPTGGHVVAGKSAGTAWVRRYAPGPDGDELWTYAHDGGDPGGDEAAAVAVDPDGNVIVAGAEGSAALQWVVWVAKVDPDGNELWSVTHDGPADNERARSVAVDSAGNVVVAGTVGGAGWVQALDPDGNERWTVDVPEAGTIGGVAVDAAGAVVIVGRAWCCLGEDDNVWVRRLDPDGNTVWTQTHDGPASGSDDGMDAAIGPDGAVFVAGHVETANHGYDIWLAKYAP